MLRVQAPSVATGKPGKRVAEMGFDQKQQGFSPAAEMHFTMSHQAEVEAAGNDPRHHTVEWEAVTHAAAHPSTSDAPITTGPAARSCLLSLENPQSWKPWCWKSPGTCRGQHLSQPRNRIQLFPVDQTWERFGGPQHCHAAVFCDCYMLPCGSGCDTSTTADSTAARRQHAFTFQ